MGIPLACSYTLNSDVIAQMMITLLMLYNLSTDDPEISADLYTRRFGLGGKDIGMLNVLLSADFLFRGRVEVLNTGRVNLSPPYSVLYLIIMLAIYWFVLVIFKMCRETGRVILKKKVCNLCLC